VCHHITKPSNQACDKSAKEIASSSDKIRMPQVTARLMGNWSKWHTIDVGTYKMICVSQKANSPRSDANKKCLLASSTQFSRNASIHDIFVIL